MSPVAGDELDRFGEHHDLLLCPAVRLPGADLGAAPGADEVGAVQPVEAAASVPAAGVGVGLSAVDVVGVEDEAVRLRADGIGFRASSGLAGAGSGVSAIAAVRRLPQRAQTMKAMNLILCFMMGGRPVGLCSARGAGRRTGEHVADIGGRS